MISANSNFVTQDEERENTFNCKECYARGVSSPLARTVIVLAAFFVFPIASRAASLALGGVSFNTLIPSGAGVSGVTDFEIDNFTGAFALPSDFPAIANLIFQNSELVLTEQGGAQQVISLGNLSPGANTPNLLDFSSTIAFVSATFTATLSSQTFTLADGTTFEASSSQISSEVLPSAGSTLSPDIDFSLITVSGTSVPTGVPEPPWLPLLLVAMATVAVGRRHSRAGA